MERKTLPTYGDGKLHLSRVEAEFFQFTNPEIKQEPGDQKPLSLLEPLFSNIVVATEVFKQLKGLVKKVAAFKDDLKNFADNETCQAFLQARPDCSIFTMAGTLQEDMTLIPQARQLHCAALINLTLKTYATVVYDGSGHLQPWISELCHRAGCLQLLNNLTAKIGLETIREYIVTALVNCITKKIEDLTQNTESQNAGTTLAQLIRHQWKVNRRFFEDLRKADAHLKKIANDGGVFFCPAKQQARFLLTNPCLDAGKFFPLVQMVLETKGETNEQYNELRDKKAQPWLAKLLESEPVLDSSCKISIKEKKARGEYVGDNHLMFIMELNYLYYLVNQFTKNSPEWTLANKEYLYRKSYLEKQFSEKLLLSTDSTLDRLKSSSALVNPFDPDLKSFQQAMFKFPKADSADAFDRELKKDIKGLGELILLLRKNLSDFRNDFNAGQF